MISSGGRSTSPTMNSQRYWTSKEEIIEKLARNNDNVDALFVHVLAVLSFITAFGYFLLSYSNWESIPLSVLSTSTFLITGTTLIVPHQLTRHTHANYADYLKDWLVVLVMGLSVVPIVWPSEIPKVLAAFQSLLLRIFPLVMNLYFLVVSTKKIGETKQALAELRESKYDFKGA